MGTKDKQSKSEEKQPSRKHSNNTYATITDICKIANNYQLTRQNYCHLCGTALTKDNEIRSHILTRTTWMSPLLKGTKEKLLGLSIKGNFDPTHNITDNKILCKSCDNNLSIYEQERENLLKEITGSNFEIKTGTIQIEGFNATRIKLAFLADLYRCSITDIEIFNRISLGQKHEEKIKNLLLGIDKIEDPSVYSVILAKVKIPIDENGVSMMPIRCSRKVHKLNTYLMILPRGWICIIKIDSQKNETIDNLSVDIVPSYTTLCDFTNERASNFVTRLILSSIST